MRLIVNLIIFFVQCAVTFVLAFSIYMTFVLLDYQGGVEGFIGATILQPIMGGIISSLTIISGLILGLPIRLSKQINSWLSKNYFIPILGTVTGLILLCVSFLPTFRETVNTTLDDQEVVKEIPNLVLAITGWFLTAFSTLHIFPTENIKLMAEEFIAKFGGRSANGHHV